MCARKGPTQKSSTIREPPLSPGLVVAYPDRQHSRCTLCPAPSNRATPVTVELDSALGARVVRDGLSTAADIHSFLELLPHLGQAHSVAGTELRKGPDPMRNYWRVS